jgi:hypothetical protein
VKDSSNAKLEELLNSNARWVNIGTQPRTTVITPTTPDAVQATSGETNQIGISHPNNQTGISHPNNPTGTSPSSQLLHHKSHKFHKSQTSNIQLTFL